MAGSHSAACCVLGQLGRSDLLHALVHRVVLVLDPEVLRLRGGRGPLRLALRGGRLAVAAQPLLLACAAPQTSEPRLLRLPRRVPQLLRFAQLWRLNLVEQFQAVPAVASGGVSEERGFGTAAAP